MDDSALPFTEDQLRLRALLRHATSLTHGLVALASAALTRYVSAPPSAPVIRHIIRKFILPAESIVRRAILILASEMTLPAPRKSPAAAQKRPPPLPPPPQEGAIRRPVFRLTEPLGVPMHGSIKDHFAARISLLDPFAPRAALREKSPPADDSVLHLRLLRRLWALELACSNTPAEARRYLRRRARALSRALKTGKPPQPPLDFLSIPGNGPALHAPFRPILEGMNTAARNTLQPRPDTS